jgi:hypothetical protein
VLAALAAVGGFVPAAVGPVAAAETPDTGTKRAGDASLGTGISSFMQASNAEVERDVEDGRFAAAMNRTEPTTRGPAGADRGASREARGATRAVAYAARGAGRDARRP